MPRPSDPQDLLLHRSWWESLLRDRPEALQPPSLTPRPDLSTPDRAVSEFELRTHDGSSLFGLFAHPTHAPGPCQARLRCCGPADTLEVDDSAADFDEWIVQEPAGRKLKDRVLDMVQLFHVIQATEGLDRGRLGTRAAPGRPLPDELRIASQLLDWNLC